MNTPPTFRLWLKRLRAEHDIKQELLADEVGCSIDTIRAFESGRRRPSRAMAERLATVLQIDPQQRPEFIRLARSTIDLAPTPHLSAPYATADTPPSRARQLPLSATPFIGRESEVADLARRLSDPACRLLTILGPGGAGKTRLALQLAADAERNAARAVAFVSLAQVATAEQVAPAIVAALGCLLHATATAEDAVLLFLRDQELLLVLDNFEHVLDAASLLTAIMREAPGVQLLVTSRERLRLRGEQVCELRGLATPPDDSEATVDRSDAALLFVERARRVAGDFALTPSNRAAVAAICRLVDGMPLGIELAASWVRALAPNEIAAEIASGLDFLTLSDPTADSRHRSMRAVIGHSWGLLVAEEQRVLARLSIFRGGCTREAAAAVAGATLPMLAGLLDKSLLRRGTSGRYELHELVRQYAADQLALDPVEAATVRAEHAAYYITWLQARAATIANDKQQAVVAEIELEIANIRTTWQYGVDQRDLWILRRLADDGLLWFYEVRSWYHEAQAACHRAAEALRSPPPATRDEEQVLGTLTGMQGWFTFRRGQPESGMRLLEESIRLLQVGDHPQWLFNSLVQLAYLAMFRGEVERATMLVERLSLLVPRIDNSWVRAHLLLQQGALDVDRAPERAYLRLSEGLSQLRAVGDRHLLTLGLTYLGDAALNLGRLAVAEQGYKEALALSSATHDGIMEVLTRTGLAAVALLRGAWADAVAEGRRAVARSHEVGEVWSRAKALVLLGAAERHAGDPVAARTTLRAALEVSLATGLLPVALEAGVGIAALDLHDATRHQELLTLLALTRGHPAKNARTVALIAEVWAALEAALGALALVEAEDKAHLLTPEQLPALLRRIV